MRAACTGDQHGIGVKVAATGPGYRLRVVDGSPHSTGHTHLNTPPAAAGFSPRRHRTDTRGSLLAHQIDRSALTTGGAVRPVGDAGGSGRLWSSQSVTVGGMSPLRVPPHHSLAGS